MPSTEQAPAATTCVACGSSVTQPRWTVRGFSIVACECGLPRTVLPEGFDPTTIYSEEYFQGGQLDGYDDYAGKADQLRREFRRTLRALTRYVPSGKLIEIGCAYGYLLDEAARTFTVSGVEISDAARAACVARELDVVRDATPEFLAARGPFDAAVMLDVIEHLSDPGDVLARLHGAMRPGGHLLLTTGDVGSVLARLMGRRWRLMTPPQHLWFFSPKTLTALLDRHGFRVRVVEHPWKLVPLKLAAFQLVRYGGPNWLPKLTPPGSVPVNLFDAMRVVAERV
jgi:SAM-dependent methyltransferase